MSYRRIPLNQTYQSTRFVCSLLRGVTAGLTNFPILHRVLALEFEDCAINFEPQIFILRE